MSEVKVNKISPRTNCGTTQLGDAGDTITVTGDLKSNSLKPATGTTLTLGASGDTITLAAGASQTGFGRTGTVDWDTTAKTTSFTAVSGNGYFVNTTSGAITVTLPATPSAGDIVSVKDYAQTFNTNNCTLARNGSNIEGTASDIVLNGQAESVTFVYVDSTKGWVLVGESLTQYGPQFVAATGGTVTTCGNFKIHVFTGPSTFCVSCAGNPAGSSTVEYLVVGGGGGGSTDWGGGAGAGGWRGYTALACSSPLNGPAALPVSVTGYPITIGAGGSGGIGPSINSPTGLGSNGSNSVFSTITSAGGGRSGNEGTNSVGAGGGSGGGGGTGGGPGDGSGGAGNTPPVSPPQGNPGGNNENNTTGYTAGGGGAGAAGAGLSPGCNTTQTGGAGGDGSYVPDGFFGPTAPTYGTTGPVASTRYFAGGAGGSSPSGAPTHALGGAGGGGNGLQPVGSPSGAGTAGGTNTGGGGGPGSANEGPQPGKSGGSGIVVIRYRFQ